MAARTTLHVDHNIYERLLVVGSVVVGLAWHTSIALDKQP